MEFNPTQQHLFEEFLNDYLLPKIDDLVFKSLSFKAKKIACDAVRIAFSGVAELLRTFLHEHYNNKQCMVVRDILISMHKLANKQTPKFPFIKAISDERFFNYTGSKEQFAHALAVWQESCREEFTKQLKFKVLSHLTSKYSLYLDVTPELTATISAIRTTNP